MHRFQGCCSVSFDRCTPLYNHIPTKLWNNSINPVYLPVSPSRQLLPGGTNCSDFYQYGLVGSILELHISKITENILYVPSLLNTSYRSPFMLLHVSLVDFFFEEYCSIWWIHKNLLIHLHVNGHLSFSQFGAIMNNGIMK